MWRRWEWSYPDVIWTRHSHTVILCVCSVCDCVHAWVVYVHVCICVWCVYVSLCVYICLWVCVPVFIYAVCRHTPV